MKAEKTTRTKTTRRILSLEELTKIAKKDGFPNFVARLEGFGNYVTFTNGKIIRVYDPKTGEKVHQYEPKDVSPEFRNPIEHIQSSTPHIMATAYMGYSTKRQRTIPKTGY